MNLKETFLWRQLNLQGSAWFHSQPGKLVSDMDGCGVFGEENTIDDFDKGRSRPFPTSWSSKGSSISQ
jgi:hypothetical protein